MAVRLLALTAGLLMSSVAAAQIHTAKGHAPRPQPGAKKPAHNSMAKTTTPFNCQQYPWPNHPHPGVKPYCDQIEARTLQDEARRAGDAEAPQRMGAGFIAVWALAALQHANALAFGGITGRPGQFQAPACHY